MLLVIFFSLFLGAARTEVTPPSVLYVEAPISPYGAVQGGVALADLTVGSAGNIERTTLLQGSSPFSDETLRVAGMWRFNPARMSDRYITSHVGVLTLFRPAAISNFG